MTRVATGRLGAKRPMSVLHCTGSASHAGGAYANDLSYDDTDRVRGAYGANYERLSALKKKYDPDNLFRLNPNVKPAP